jgi:hypothetical protein
MLTRWQFWLLTALSVVMAALIGAGMLRFADNRKLQLEVSQRAQFIQQTVPLDALSREMVSALAQLAVRGPDDQIRAMLSRLGISVSENAAAAPPGASAPAQQPARKK